MAQQVQPAYQGQQEGYMPQGQQGGHMPQSQQGGYMPQGQQTTVVLVQPAGYGRQSQIKSDLIGDRDWSTGLCGCFEECGSCVCGFFCTNIYTCMQSSRVDECCLIGASPLRSKTRYMLGIRGSICEDHCMTWFCLPCVVSQVSRELTKAGWHN